MNKLTIILLTLFISCKSPSQEKDAEKKNAVSLQKSFSDHKEEQFLEEFPSDFKTFKNTFGWDDAMDAPEPLYKNSENYIRYFFTLLEKPQNKKYESKIVSISENAKWEADAVNYFQDGSLEYIKKNNRYELVNSLNNKNAQQVLSFLFDGPVVTHDAEFVANLNPEKQNIVQNLVKANISPEKKRSTMSTYENNDAFFVKSFDVNKDGIADKIVSSKPYQGNDLFVFYGDKNRGYQLVLETTNFSEDGGNIIEKITQIPNQKGLQITTTFPDRGYYEKDYTLIPENNSWFLKKIVYKTMSDQSENAVKYICNVTQNIDITKSGWTDKINQIPSENERNKKCRTETNSGQLAKYIINDPDGFTNLREENNAKSRIVQKINSGENVSVINSSSDWFYVETASGNKGFVHKSRLKKSKS